MTNSFPSKVTLIEVGPRDGLQNETTVLTVAQRVELIQRLAKAGLHHIEVGSFVAPQWVPQMAATDEVIQQLALPNLDAIALVPNMKGLDRAIEVGVKHIAIFTAASESFCQKNINCSIEESFNRFTPVVEKAKSLGMKIRGYISCVLGCPYEGKITPQQVLPVAQKLKEVGCDEISLGDTIGVGTAGDAVKLVNTVAEIVPLEHIAIHFHNTYGQALANIYACLERGVSRIDTAIGGLGGCPYAKGASGNVATEDVLYMLNGLGIETGVKLDQLLAISADLSKTLGRTLPSSVFRATT